MYFVDGKFTEREGLNISIDDRGYYFGDGVYEVIKVYGGELYTAEEHIRSTISKCYENKNDNSLY